MITKVNKFDESCYKINLFVFSYEKTLKDTTKWSLQTTLKIFGITVYNSEVDSWYREDLEVFI